MVHKSLYTGKKARDLLLKWLQNTSCYHTIKISARRIEKLKRTLKIWAVSVRKCHTVVKTSSTQEQKSNKPCLRQWFHIFKAERWPTTKLSFRLTFLICEELLWGIKLSCQLSELCQLKSEAGTSPKGLQPCAAEGPAKATDLSEPKE